MEKNEIKITVEGNVGTGKSLIVHYIESLLKNGLNVKNIKVNNPDFVDYKEEDLATWSIIEKLENSTITIEEVTTSRSTKPTPPPSTLMKECESEGKKIYRDFSEDSSGYFNFSNENKDDSKDCVKNDEDCFNINNIGDVKKVNLNKNDVIMVKIKEYPNPFPTPKIKKQFGEHCLELFKKTFPDNKVMVIDDKIDYKIVSTNKNAKQSEKLNPYINPPDCIRYINEHNGKEFDSDGKEIPLPKDDDDIDVNDSEEFSLNDWLLEKIKNGDIDDKSLLKVLKEKEQDLLDEQKKVRDKKLIDNLKNSKPRYNL